MAAKAAEPARKQMYRHRLSGQLGYIVDRHGKEMIRLDRPAEEIYLPFAPDLWEAEKSERPLSRPQVARVAFDADRALCRALGNFDDGRKLWESLRDDDRVAWIANGPPAGLRRQLYDAVLKLFPDAR